MRMSNWPVRIDRGRNCLIGDLGLSFARHFLIYLEFDRLLPAHETALRILSDHSPAFERVFSEALKKSQVKALSLDSILKHPIFVSFFFVFALHQKKGYSLAISQRLGQYDELFRMILRHTPPSSMDFELLHYAHAEIIQIVQQIEDQRTERLAAEQVASIQSQLKSNLSILSPGRRFQLSGVIQKIIPGRIQRKKRRWFFLFNDLLLCLKRSYELKAYVDLRWARVERKDAKSFLITDHRPPSFCVPVLPSSPKNEALDGILTEQTVKEGFVFFSFAFFSFPLFSFLSLSSLFFEKLHHHRYKISISCSLQKKKPIVGLFKLKRICLNSCERENGHRLPVGWILPWIHHINWLGKSSAGDKKAKMAMSACWNQNTTNFPH
jgi:hypothetical protein